MKGKFRTIILSAILVASSWYVLPGQLFQSATVSAAPNSGQSNAAYDQKVIARISAERMYKDVHFLSETNWTTCDGNRGREIYGEISLRNVFYLTGTKSRSRNSAFRIRR